MPPEHGSSRPRAVQSGQGPDRSGQGDVRSAPTVVPADRAQSVFDFSLGISLFLVVVIGVLVFVPSAFAALDDDGGIAPNDRIAAERAADYLAAEGFGDANAPTEFNYFCIVAYFDDQSACEFRAGQSPAADASLPGHRPINVTVEADLDNDGEREILCWHGSAPESFGSPDNIWVTPADADCEVPFSTDTSAADNVEYAASTRVGTLRTIDLGPTGTDRLMVYVTVRTW